MSADIRHLRPCATDPATALRYIADQYERGEFGDSCMMLVCGSEVYHMGTVNDAEASANAVFDMEIGKAKLMARALGLL